MKELQQQWKAVGPVPREDDQRLWSEFRVQCDAIFQKRQQAAADFNATLESNKARALALCAELEQIGALSGTALLEGALRTGELRAEFEALGELPKPDARELRRRFERAQERCEEAVAEQKSQDVERGWTGLLQAADRVRAYRLALARGADALESEALRNAAEQAIGSGTGWPKAGLEALKKELSNGSAGDLTANEAALRKLCIRAEILVDAPTPVEDQALRREYQVQRLLATMGQGA